MKGQVGTQIEGLLWPNSAVMAQLRALSRPRNDVLLTDDTATIDTEDLLWPAKLINEQARSQLQRDFSRPIAMVTFGLNILLAFIIGPMQLILAATSNDYAWVTASYFPTALRYVLLVTGLMALVNCAALGLAWRSAAKPTRLTVSLVCGSLIEMALFWLSGQVATWQPHQLTVFLISAAVIWFVVVLLLSKQYLEEIQNDLLTKVTLVLLMISSFFGAIGCLSQFAYANNRRYDSVQLNQIQSSQEQARIEGVPEQLSNNVFTLCNGKYSLVHLSADERSGLFECHNGEVYSVAEIEAEAGRVKAAATYLGTTNDKILRVDFPNDYYLYRHMAEIVGEDELVMMVRASSERELLDNFTPQFLAYWREHPNNLYLNVFYNRDTASIASTKDYILMVAMDTMALIDKLPHGSIIEGLYDGRIVNYQFVGDRELIALNELGADPNLYAASSRDALTAHRHISVHLRADETFDEESLRQRLQDGLVGGL